MQIRVPCGKDYWSAEVADDRVKAILRVKKQPTDKITGKPLVEAAMLHPIASPPLHELAKEKNNIVIITSDHTRMLPSKITMPFLLEGIRKGNPHAQIKILVGTGFHRATTQEELVHKFGVDIVKNETFVIHNAFDDAQLADVGTLPSGGRLRLNKLAVEADLVVAEGMIEPHLFAGYSGGRKSVLPGISGMDTIMANHCSEFVAHPNARPGRMYNNPLSDDMLFAAEACKLRFILNVVLDGKHRIAHAVAGDPFEAHRVGCEALASDAAVSPIPADIVIGTNGGYPLDQNVYQHVKALTSLEATVNPGGVIILCAELSDGHGSQEMCEQLKIGIREAAEMIASTPRDKTIPDQWATQILCRVLLKHRVIFATPFHDVGLLHELGFETAQSLQEALCMAEETVGKTASITVLPDAVATIVG